MYYKGGNMLHMIRQLIEDDEKWRQILRGLNKEFYHQTVTTKQIEDYISEKSGIDLSEFFDQYLRTVMVPKLQYSIDGKNLKFRYVDIVKNFDMPLIALINGKEEWIYPTSEWKTKTLSSPILNFQIKEDFYVNSEEKN
jgi:hypothetical protein